MLFSCSQKFICFRCRSPFTAWFLGFSYIYVYVCMYIHIHIYIHTRVCTYIYTYIYVYVQYFLLWWFKLHLKIILKVLFLHCIMVYENSLDLSYPAAWKILNLWSEHLGHFPQKLFHSLLLKALSFWKKYIWMLLKHHFIVIICLNIKFFTKLLF